MYIKAKQKKKYKKGKETKKISVKTMKKSRWEKTEQHRRHIIVMVRTPNQHEQKEKKSTGYKRTLTQ